MTQESTERQLMPTTYFGRRRMLQGVGIGTAGLTALPGRPGDAQGRA
jgi:hypothetical protein